MENSTFFNPSLTRSQNSLSKKFVINQGSDVMWQSLTQEENFSVIKSQIRFITETNVIIPTIKQKICTPGQIKSVQTFQIHNLRHSPIIPILHTSSGPVVPS